MLQTEDAVPHKLDPRVIPFGRLVGRIVMACVSLVLGVALLLTTPARAPFGVWLGEAAGWIIAMTVLFRWAHRWPWRSYRHASYLLDDRGIEIRSGVYWRKVVAVPRSRVQHIDVSQGPLQRSYGLATLTIFTAGTAYSSVPLAGLSHETALALRDALLPRRADDAV